jgi:hypothetical protein
LKKHYECGDCVVYRKTKYGPAPAPRARSVFPAGKGENYTYQVDKYRCVVVVYEDGSVLLRSRSGKTRRVLTEDPNMRPAHWWERLFYRSRFPRPEP